MTTGGTNDSGSQHLCRCIGIFVIMIKYSVYRCDELVWECIVLRAIGGSHWDLYTPMVQET